MSWKPRIVAIALIAFFIVSETSSGCKRGQTAQTSASGVTTTPSAPGQQTVSWSRPPATVEILERAFKSRFSWQYLLAKPNLISPPLSDIRSVEARNARITAIDDFLRSSPEREKIIILVIDRLYGNPYMGERSPKSTLCGLTVASGTSHPLPAALADVPLVSSEHLGFISQDLERLLIAGDDDLLRGVYHSATDFTIIWYFDGSSWKTGAWHGLEATAHDLGKEPEKLLNVQLFFRIAYFIASYLPVKVDLADLGLTGWVYVDERVDRDARTAGVFKRGQNSGRSNRIN